jgi:hypothetical protein
MSPMYRQLNLPKELGIFVLFTTQIRLNKGERISRLNWLWAGWLGSMELMMARWIGL